MKEYERTNLEQKKLLDTYGQKFFQFKQQLRLHVPQLPISSFAAKEDPH